MKLLKTEVLNFMYPEVFEQCLLNGLTLKYKKTKTRNVYIK